MTTTDYVSSISLLPTDDFLRYVAEKQWGTEASYGVGFSPVIPEFYSTTNSEWLCLNSESEFLSSPLGTAAIKNPFSYTRPESSPVFVAFDNLLIPSSKLNRVKSLFLFREVGGVKQVINASNYTKTNTTTAPLIDCFSRECMTWFDSNTDWLTGFGSVSGSLSELVVDSNGVVFNKSEDVLSGLIPYSTKPIAYTNISFSTVTTLNPFVVIEFSSEVEYVKTESTSDYNVLFLFNSNSLVAFVGCVESKNDSFYSESLKTKVCFDSQEVIII